MFDSLAQLVPVTFEEFRPDAPSSPDALVLIGEDHPITSQLGVPTYIWERNPARFTTNSAQVEFSPWPSLHLAIRGQCLSESTRREISPCSVQDGDVVVAVIDGCPVWAVRGPVHHGLVHYGLVHRVSIQPPSLNGDELLYSHLTPARWLSLLPLLHFLRSVTRDIDWQASPTKACFAVDDPNLHALTYGYLDFRQIANDAKGRNYHFVVATVPMDAWYVNAKAALLFREHSNFISLTPHGNEHTKCELAGRNGDQLAQLAQALQRVERMERRTGLAVSRVMMAPHSACSESNMDLMLKLGYEGACISRQSLLLWNEGKRWPVDFGLGSVLWMGTGFPVIYRLKLPRREVHTKVRLTAFLGQPIIPYGHHADWSSGLGHLRSVADTVNSCGAQWADLNSIMRTNFRTRTDGPLLHVQMCSRRITLRVPEQATSVSIERPWMTESDLEYLTYTDHSQSAKTLQSGRITDPIAVTPGSEMSISALPTEQIDYRTLTGPPVRIWPVVRRVLVEARDRLRPVVRR